VDIDEQRHEKLLSLYVAARDAPRSMEKGYETPDRTGMIAQPDLLSERPRVQKRA